MKRLLMAAALAAGAWMAAPATAGAAPFDAAEALDRLPAEYVRHTREHRLMEVQRNLEMQQRRPRRPPPGYGPRGYGPRGYGPPGHYGRPGPGRYYEGPPRYRSEPGYWR